MHGEVVLRHGRRCDKGGVFQQAGAWIMINAWMKIHSHAELSKFKKFIYSLDFSDASGRCEDRI